VWFEERAQLCFCCAVGDVANEKLLHDFPLFRLPDAQSLPVHRSGLFHFSVAALILLALAATGIFCPAASSNFLVLIRR
jgi:hypothetical protein